MKLTSLDIQQGFLPDLSAHDLRDAQVLHCVLLVAHALSQVVRELFSPLLDVHLGCLDLLAYSQD